MNIFLALILISVIIYLVYNGETSRKRGDHQQSASYYRLSFIIFLATIGAFFYPSLKEKADSLKKKYNRSI